MTNSDYICSYLASKGYKHVFGLTGGGIARMFDSASRYLKPIYLLHEQSASMAAVAYSMLTDHKGLCFVTTGPGGTNALTGLLGAWQDSVPCLFFSGQARSNQLAYNRGIRQGAVQDFHILDVVKPMTNYSRLLLNSTDVEYVIDEAIDAGTSGRQGPSWIDVPIDVQWAESDSKQLKYTSKYYQDTNLVGDIDKVVDAISKSSRPVILLGYGCRLAGITDRVVSIAREFNIPVVTTWNTMDAMDSSDPLYLGVVGTMGGRRGANMAMCNADILLAIGTRLPVTVTGNLLNPFSKDTTVVCVNNDSNELRYRENIIDIPICYDVSIFVDSIYDSLTRTSNDWYDTIGKYRELNSVYVDHESSDVTVNPYIWCNNLSNIIDTNDTVVLDGGGTILSVAYGSLNLRGQRAINMTAMGCMGTGLPMSIGAHYATGNRVVVMCGDGSLMLNIHDLATIACKNLPIKIFIQDNSGYLSIRNTQDIYFNSKYCGSHKCEGLDLPDLKKVIEGFSIPVWIANSNTEADTLSNTVMNHNGPAVCILNIDANQSIIPTPTIVTNSNRISRSLPLCNMSPIIDNSDLMFVNY
jgi:acetolactate synthase-1/2/3 large subunit